MWPQAERRAARRESGYVTELPPTAELPEAVTVGAS